MNSSEQLRTTKDYSGLSRTVQEDAGPFMMSQEHSGQLRTTLVPFQTLSGLVRTTQNHSWAHWDPSGYPKTTQECSGLLKMPQDHLGQPRTVKDFSGALRTIQDVLSGPGRSWNLSEWFMTIQNYLGPLQASQDLTGTTQDYSGQLRFIQDYSRYLMTTQGCSGPLNRSSGPSRTTQRTLRTL